MRDAWMKQLGLGVSHEWSVSLTTRAPFEYNFVWLALSRTRGTYTLKAAVIPQDAFVRAHSNLPAALPAGHAAEAILPDDIGRTLEQSLHEVGVETLRSKPLEGTDGLTISVDVRTELRTHRFEAWCPTGAQRDVLQLLIGACVWHLHVLAELPGVQPIAAWVQRSQGPEISERTRPPRIEGLMLRAQVGRLRTWWSFFDRGVCQGFIGADLHHAGSAMCPRLVPLDTLCSLHALVQGLALQTIEDDTRDVEMTLQQVTEEGLVARHYAWRRAEFYPGEMARIVALHALIAPLCVL